MNTGSDDRISPPTRAHETTPQPRRPRSSLRFYRIALALSVVLNVLLIAGVWYYNSIEDTLSWVQTIVGLFN